MSAGSFASTMLVQTARAAVPYVLAAQGGLWSERAGVVNVALEGMMLSGALAGVVAAATGGAWAGVLAALVVGASLGAFHAWVTERGRVDPVVSGVAINLMALGGTRVVLRALYHSSSNSPALGGLTDPTFPLAVASVVASVLVLTRTRFGLWVRASGDAVETARAVGIPVVGVRTVAVAAGSALAGLGGAALAFDQQQFQSGMTGGRGFIALAIVVLSGLRFGRAALLCVAFAALDALQVALQARVRELQDLVQMLPYLAALLALGLLARRPRTSR